MFNLPRAAAMIIKRLNAHGHQAYAVGGCVRDSLLGIRPNDWDICTSALPEEMQAVIHLVYFEQLSAEDAGKVLKKNRKQVYNLLYRAKAELRKLLGEDGDGLL